MMVRLAFPRHWLAICATALVFLFASAAVHTRVHAQEQEPGTPSTGDLQTVDENGNRKSCSELDEVKGGVMLGRIVPCIIYTVQGSAQKFSGEMIDFMMPIFMAFLTLVIIVFGLKVMQNEGQIQAQGLVLIIKIAFVIGVLQMIPGTLIPISYGIMEETQEIVMSTLQTSGTQLTCDVARYEGEQTPAIWAQMDCLMGQLYGFATGSADASGEKRPNMVMASSIFGLLGGFFFGGSFGVALFLVCIGVLVGMFMMIMRVTMAYLNCYLIIAVYMILAPIYLPMILLKVTEGYFRKWVDGILASFLLPVMICAYTIMALLMYDKVMFSDDSLMKKLFDYDFVKDAQDPSAPACKLTVANNLKDRTVWTGKSAGEIYANELMKNFQPIFGGTNNACAGIQKTQLNLQNLQPKSAEFASKKKAFTALFMDVVKMLFMVWLIDAGFKNMMSVLRPMIGSGTVSNTVNLSGKAEEQVKAGWKSSENYLRGRSSYVDKETGEVRDAWGDAKGGDFIARIPTALGDAGKVFFDGIKKD